MHAPQPARTRWLSLLWFPLFFAAAMSLIFIPAFSRPTPHQLPIGVVGPPTQAAQLQDALDAVHARGFVVTPYADARAAADAVADDRLAAAVVVDGSPRVLIATAASKIRADYLAEVLGRHARTQQLPVVDVRPRAAGDVSGVGLFFYGLPLLLVGMITSIVLVQRGASSLRLKAAMIAVTGAGASTLAWTVVVWRDVLPADPRLLVYGLLLTQIVGWVTSAVAVLAKPYFLPISMTFVLIVGIPTAGGTVSADMLPTALGRLHEVLPFAQFLDAARASAYAVGSVTWPLFVLAGWAVTGALLILLAHAVTRRPEPTGPRRSV